MSLKNNYITYQGYECLSACLVNYLRFMNYRISGSDIFFIGSGSGFIFKKNEEENRRIVATRQYEANYDFCRKIGIDYSVKSMKGESATVILEAMTEKKMCVTIQASTLFLTYNPIFLKGEGFHFINILHVDREGGRMYVSDGYIPTVRPCTYEGWISAADIIRGWERTDNLVFFINTMPIGELLETEINNVYSYMVNSVKSFIKGDGKNLPNNKRLCEYVGSILIGTDDQDLYRKEMSNLRFNFKANGFFAYKYHILDQMQRTQSELSREYEDMIKKWEAWFMNIMKLRDVYQTERNRRSYEKFMYLTEIEEKILCKLL
ncbi:BtrH N-terminal domain-containing protein [Hungatella sp.]|uniref:BtrH N-terminal domain-containing protein n=1 Tax=Hungatella sp. TaxID=2613924 RepID=UPI002A83EFF2|nr:BtrH N-terminal domain-containing protein [Hungatella sp.]